MTAQQLTRAVTLELSQVSPRTFDAVGTVKYFAERGFNTLVVFAVGYLYGESYFPSRIMQPHDELGDRDLFGEILTEAKSRNLKVFAYVNSFFGGPNVYEKHPDWTARWADDRETTQVRAKGMCLNSPYADMIIDVSAEVCEKYPVDGVYLDEPSLQSWCACRFCKEKYKIASGSELPLTPEIDRRQFAGFLEWRTQCVADFVGNVGAACRKARPEIMYFAQHAFPLSSTSHDLHKHLFWGMTSGRTPPQFEDWYRPSFYGQDIRRVGEHLDIIGIEPWRRFAGYDAWWQGACVNYARAAGNGKPVLPLMEYPHFPWGLGRLSDDELQVNCADVIANGGDLWWPMYAPGAADRGGWDALSRVFDALDGMRPAQAVDDAEVGIVVSRASAERFALGKVDEYYLDDLVGTIQIVRELHVPYSLLVDENVTATSLAQKRVIIAPSAACLSPHTARLLEEFVRAGGLFVAQGFVGTHDEAGQLRTEQLLGNLLGLTLGPDRLHSRLGYLVSSTDVSKRVLVRDECPVFTVSSATVRYNIAPSRDLFVAPQLSDLSPGLTTRQVDKGTAIAIGPQLGRLRLRFELFEAVDLYRDLLSGVDFRVRGSGLGPQVGIHVWSAEGKRHIVLVNMTSISETGKVSSLSHQTISVAGATHAHSTRGSEIDVRRNNGVLEIDVRQLAHWDCIVVS